MAKLLCRVDSPQTNTCITSYDGLNVDLVGANSGVMIRCFEGEKGNNHFRIYKTAGSRPGIPDKLITQFKEEA